MRLVKLALPLLGFTLLGWQLATPGGLPIARAQVTGADNIVDFAFDPAEVDVPAGTTVVWTNVGPTPHTVAAADMSWTSDILMAGQTFSYTFTTPGTYPIICTLHPEMTGTVVVQ